MKRDLQKNRSLAFCEKRNLAASGRAVPPARFLRGQLLPWRNTFGGVSVSDAKRLKEFELENARLNRLASTEARAFLAYDHAVKQGDGAIPPKAREWIALAVALTTPAWTSILAWLNAWARRAKNWLRSH